MRYTERKRVRDGGLEEKSEREKCGLKVRDELVADQLLNCGLEELRLLYGCSGQSE